jgi:hypothetical protein
MFADRRTLGNREMGQTSEATASSKRTEIELPTEPVCAGCDVALAEPYGYCSNCRVAYCFACGRGHYCTAGCAAAGCLAGLCVREVRGGVLSSTWGLPKP